MSSELIAKGDADYGKYICDWSKMSVPDKRMFMQYATSYGFDPFLGEMMILFSKPYITHKGLLKKMNLSKRLLPKRDVLIIRTKEDEVQATVTLYISPEGYTTVEFIKELSASGISVKDILDMMAIKATAKSSPDINKALSKKSTGEATDMANYMDDIAIKSAECKIIRRMLSMSLPSVEETHSIDADDVVHGNSDNVPATTTNDAEDIALLRKEVGKIIKKHGLNTDAIAELFYDRYKCNSDEATKDQWFDFVSELNEVYSKKEKK